MQLLQTDETFQEKLKAAAEAYTGEQTEESVFDDVLAPVVREYGITFTLDDLKAYAESQATQKLDLDETNSQISSSAESRTASFVSVAFSSVTFWNILLPFCSETIIINYQEVSERSA